MSQGSDSNRDQPGTRGTGTTTPDRSGIPGPNPPEEDGKTGVYSDDLGNATGVYLQPADGARTGVYGSSSGEQATGVYEDDGAKGKRRSPPQGRTATHGIGPGDTVELPDGQFTVTGILSGDGVTGEAVVYSVDNRDGGHFALKLYREFTNVREEPNPQALERIQSIVDPDILRLHSYGTGDRKYLGKYCFELCDLAEGGTLLDIANGDLASRYTPDFVVKEVVPQLLLGIRCLHRHRIYHCDLKPQNVFYLDEGQVDLVIGDYGSAKTSDTDARRDAVHTGLVKGSVFYRAPEQALGLVSEKNDYFSFGMILVRLLYPDVDEMQGFRRIYARAVHHRPILDFRAELGRLNELIGGLTLYDVEKRWGDSEVERWLNGETVPVAYAAETELQPIKLGRGVVLGSLVDLLDYVESEPTWYEKIVADQAVFLSIRQWLLAMYDAEVGRSFDRMVRYYSQEGEPYVKEAVLRYFVPERPVQVDFKAFELYRASDVERQTSEIVAQLDTMALVAPREALRLVFFQMEFSLRKLAEAADEGRAATARDVLERIRKCLSTAEPCDFVDHKCAWYVEVDREDIIRIAWELDRSRGMRVDAAHALATPDDVSSYLAGTDNPLAPENLLELRQFLLHSAPANDAGWRKDVEQAAKLLDWQSLLWRVGGRTLCHDGAVIDSPDQIRALGDSAIQQLMNSGLLPAWLKFARKSNSQATELAVVWERSLKQVRPAMVRWTFGARELPVGTTMITETKQVAELADDVVDELMLNEMIPLWLRFARKDERLATQLATLWKYAPKASRAAAVRWQLGARTLVCGSTTITSPEQLRTLSDQTVDSLMKTELLPLWLTCVHGQAALADELQRKWQATSFDTRGAAIRWLLGATDLRVGDRSVTTLDELLKVGDHDPDGLVEELISGRLRLWLRSIGVKQVLVDALPDAGHEIPSLELAEATLQALGAEAPKLVIDTSGMDIGRIPDGGKAAGILKLKAVGRRGAIVGQLQATGGCTVKAREGRAFHLSLMQEGESVGGSVFDTIPIENLRAGQTKEVAVLVSVPPAGRGTEVVFEATTNCGTVTTEMSLRVISKLLVNMRIPLALGAMAAAAFLALLFAVLVHPRLAGVERQALADTLWVSWAKFDSMGGWKAFDESGLLGQFGNIAIMVLQFVVVGLLAVLWNVLWFVISLLLYVGAAVTGALAQVRPVLPSLAAGGVGALSWKLTHLKRELSFRRLLPQLFIVGAALGLLPPAVHAWKKGEFAQERVQEQGNQAEDQAADDAADAAEQARFEAERAEAEREAERKAELDRVREEARLAAEEVRKQKLEEEEQKRREAQAEAERKAAAEELAARKAEEEKRAAEAKKQADEKLAAEKAAKEKRRKERRARRKRKEREERLAKEAEGKKTSEKDGDDDHGDSGPPKGARADRMTMLGMKAMKAGNCPLAIQYFEKAKTLNEEHGFLDSLIKKCQE